jgi:hypothetical protein
MWKVMNMNTNQKQGTSTKVWCVSLVWRAYTSASSSLVWAVLGFNVPMIVSVKAEKNVLGFGSGGGGAAVVVVPLGVTPVWWV